MKVRELVERLQEFPDYLEVYAGPRAVAEVRDVTIVKKLRAPSGHVESDAAVIVVLES